MVIYYRGNFGFFPVFPYRRIKLYRKIVSATYVLNIVFQAFFTLVCPAGLCFLISWLLVRFASAPKWIYAPALIIGVMVGLISMVKFIISAMGALEKLEEQHKAMENEKPDLDARRDRLEEEMKKLSLDLPATAECSGQEHESEPSSDAKAQGDYTSVACNNEARPQATFTSDTEE